MFILNLLALLFLIIFGISFITVFILGIILGPTLKKYDPNAYQRIYTFFIPCSLLILNDYVLTSQNLEKFPTEKRRVLNTLKFLIPTAFISTIMTFILLYFSHQE